MIVKSCFNLVEIADEVLLVPLEDAAASFRGVVVLNDAAGFMIRQMSSPKTKEQLVEALVNEYDVDHEKAKIDVEELLHKLISLGVLEN